MGVRGQVHTKVWTCLNSSAGFDGREGRTTLLAYGGMADMGLWLVTWRGSPEASIYIYIYVCSVVRSALSSGSA